MNSRNFFASMKLEPRYLRVTAFSLFPAVIVAIPFCVGEARLKIL
jgi:hypothetical protein